MDQRLMTEQEFEEWKSTREAVGREIDIATCELGRWHAYDADPYCVGETKLCEQMQQVGTNRFVRTTQSRGWVHEGDVPQASVKALYDRLYQQYQQREAMKAASNN
jgi:hypothetical protein